MAVLVLYESKRDQTRRVADAIAKAAASRDIATLVRAIEEAVPSHIASSTAVIAGCTTPGDVPFGGKPTVRIAAWINCLEPLNGKPVGVYSAYRFFPHTFADTTTRVAETLQKLSDRFELKGGKVVATQGINLKSVDRGAGELVDRSLVHVPEG